MPRPSVPLVSECVCWRGGRSQDGHRSVWATYLRGPPLCITTTAGPKQTSLDWLTWPVWASSLMLDCVDQRPRNGLTIDPSDICSANLLFFHQPAGRLWLTLLADEVGWTEDASIDVKLSKTTPVGCNLQCFKGFYSNHYHKFEVWSFPLNLFMPWAPEWFCACDYRV